MKRPLLVRSDTPCASYLPGPIHGHTSIHPIPRIIQDQLTHSCINPNTQTFPLLLDWKSENRTKRSAFLNQDACRGQPEGLRYILVVPSAIYMWRPARGMEICRAGTPWHVPASWICRLSQEEWNSDVSSPGFMRERKSKSDKSGQVETWRAVSGVVFI